MTVEQKRTLTHFKAEYERQRELCRHGRVKSTADWHAYQNAERAYVAYAAWLARFVQAKAA